MWWDRADDHFMFFVTVSAVLLMFLYVFVWSDGGDTTYTPPSQLARAACVGHDGVQGYVVDSRILGRPAYITCRDGYATQEETVK